MLEEGGPAVTTMENEMSIRRSSCLALCPIPLFCSGLAAQVPADVFVNGGSTATITLQITVSSSLGTETRSDTITVPAGGGGSILLYPTEEPFNGVELTSMQFVLGDGQLNYEFFCTPFGCIDVTMNLANLRATLASVPGATIIETGHADFFAPWNLQANYSIDSILFSSSGDIDTTSEVNFGTTFVTGGGSVFIHELSLGQIFSQVPPENLPDGFAVDLLTIVDLSGASLSGNYEVPPEFDCGNGGDCGSIGGAGCNDVDCCNSVCSLDASCCDQAWDGPCVTLATQVCGIAPDNDGCGNPRTIGLERLEFTTYNCDTDGPNLITECGSSQSGVSFVNDAWFVHTALADNGIEVSTCGHAGFDTRLAVYDQCNGTLIACNDDSSGCPGGTSRMSFMGTAGQQYLIRVGGATGPGSGEIDVAWTEPPLAPTSLAAQWPRAGGGNGHYYAVYALSGDLDYAEAMEAAERFGGHLATITSPEEQDFINRNLQISQLGGPTAIGLYQVGDDEPAGGWTWVTGERFNWSNWADGEPNDFGAAEDWAMIYPGGTWNDNTDNCRYALIEFESDPMLDTATWKASDGGNGSTYKAIILPDRVSWSEANAIAISEGGSLVSMETPEEAQWLHANMAAFVPMWSMTFYNGGPWIGLVNQGKGWEWLSGQPFDWDGWFPGEPNGTGSHGCFYASTQFSSNQSEDFDGVPSGELFNSAVYADVFGNKRLKLVSDSQPSTTGAWKAAPIDRTLIGFTASFRFSFKNQDGGPGDGFSFIWGELSDTSGNRLDGGEFGVNAFIEDGAGLSIGLRAYPAGGLNGIDGRWGGSEFAFSSIDFSSVTYTDYQQAGQPENMPTLYVNWSIDSGVSVSIAFPASPPQQVFSGAGLGELQDIDPTDWSFGFVGRNGAIDMDVLVGDFVVQYDFMPTDADTSGAPALSFDDTYDQNLRRSMIIEMEKVGPCPEDLNLDQIVDGGDLAILLAQWGTCTRPPCPADLDGDGVIDGVDLAILLSRWGSCG